ncbi:MlaA family lipoprotein [Parachitinimonas caeni]|uniref:VacJ family lipoprotein n=1 Tax=Parachitinimonas caeni TaxID=3031301 RepID=A0ABT7DSV8_9NEIS|nr:VacJ family lipoprotein [Parachitinimonas caeni]MDK2123156.1 VacJ family lipoprotein [Parachitinimonas caeni]
MRTLLSICVAVALTGCATPANRYDPLEPLNRKVYAFNDALDRAVVKPVAQGYVAITPAPVRTAFGNFLGNLQDVYIALNGLLQGKVRQAGSDAGRFVVNSTLGLLGLIDIATPIGFPKHNEDFGQTLGSWGIGSGPYLVLPVLGPRTLRDSVDIPVAAKLQPINQINDVQTLNGLRVMEAIDQRARLLSAGELLDTAALDPYSFLRDGYLQRRYNLIYDGSPPKPLPMGEDDVDVKGLDVSEPASPSIQ